MALFSQHIVELINGSFMASEFPNLIIKNIIFVFLVYCVIRQVHIGLFDILCIWFFVLYGTHSNETIFVKK